ncbi:hypothetical protein PMAYCL1PPCAC_17485, partial [Pristionchus mayeri]
DVIRRRKISHINHRKYTANRADRLKYFSTLRRGGDIRLIHSLGENTEGGLHQQHRSEGNQSEEPYHRKRQSQFIAKESRQESLHDCPRVSEGELTAERSEKRTRAEKGSPRSSSGWRVHMNNSCEKVLLAGRDCATIRWGISSQQNPRHQPQ